MCMVDAASIYNISMGQHNYKYGTGSTLGKGAYSRTQYLYNTTLL